MQKLGMNNIKAHEDGLTAYARELWGSLPGVTLVGTAKEKGGVFSFVVDGIHPQDLAFVLDKEGIIAPSRWYTAWAMKPSPGHLSGFTPSGKMSKRCRRQSAKRRKCFSECAQNLDNML